MRSLTQTARLAACTLFVALVAGMAMENSADAQGCRKRSGGGGGHVRHSSGQNHLRVHCHIDRHGHRQCHREVNIRRRVKLHCHNGHCAPVVRHDWYDHLCDYYGSHDLHDCGWRLRRCKHVRARRHLHWDYDRWCRYFSPSCYWWYNYCGTQYYFDPSFCAAYDWQYYQCQGYRWHLGLSCIYIPGRGYGIINVHSGSPAALAGLQPGMIITAANGSQLINEQALPEMLTDSNGQMNLNVVTDASGQQARVGLDMNRIGT